MLDPSAYKTSLHISLDERNKMCLKIKSDDQVWISLSDNDLVDLVLQAVKAAKGTVKDADLPVNFYVKLNKKLDAVDAAGRAPAFNWGNFTRGAVAVCTMLIVGVFVYTIGKQTGNFSDVRMKQDEQMPKTAEAPVETKSAELAAGWKVQQKPVVELAKKKTVEQEDAFVKNKTMLDVAEKKDAGLGYNS